VRRWHAEDPKVDRNRFNDRDEDIKPRDDRDVDINLRLLGSGGIDHGGGEQQQNFNFMVDRWMDERLCFFVL
jgi:hypothetical protein